MGEQGQNTLLDLYRASRLWGVFFLFLADQLVAVLCLDALYTEGGFGSGHFFLRVESLEAAPDVRGSLRAVARIVTVVDRLLVLG